jgi:prefoldin subunit 5
MNIQAKVNEIREAVSNMNNLVEGMKGLQEALVPQARIEAVALNAIHQDRIAMHEKVDGVERIAASMMGDTRQACQQMTGEAIQLFNTELSHYKARLEALEEQVAELVETFQGFAEAATRKRRPKA